MLAGQEASIEIVQKWLQRRNSDDADTGKEIMIFSYYLFLGKSYVNTKWLIHLFSFKVLIILQGK